MILLFMQMCKYSVVDAKKSPIARVYDKYIYSEDIDANIPQSMKKDDSIVMARNYINQWIIRQLMYRKAQANLPEEMKDINAELEEYSISLLIYRYQQYFGAKKKDTAISVQELNEYYQKYSSMFLLDAPAIEASFIKIDKKAPKIYILYNLLHSIKHNDQKILKEYCEKHAKEFFLEPTWYYLDSILHKYPVNIYGQPDNYLKYNKLLETNDSIYKYFFYIKNYRLKNEIIPLNLIKENLKEILLNKKKNDMLKHLENELYQSAKKHGEVEIY
ncbi:MAG: hypothetical protein HY738_23420 [Bacteroidia bacterium]|nr:hypothetical protein [Bacteroidia bacterium]